MREQFSGLLVDGPMAGRRFANVAPHLVLTLRRRLPPLSTIDVAVPFLAEEDRGYYQHCEMYWIDYGVRRPLGFWYDPMLAKGTDDPTLHIIRRLITGFRPIAEDKRQRRDEAEKEMRAACEAMRLRPEPSPWRPDVDA